MKSPVHNLTTLLLGICLAVSMPVSEAEAGPPGVAVFNYAESLAVEIDCSGLLTSRRVELLDHGYPLSFILTVSLFRDDRLWLDSRLAEVSARFRVVHQKWNDRLTLELSDLAGSFTTEEFESLSEILNELEERLFCTFGRISALQDSYDYYFEVVVRYRSLTFEDVKSADRWLKDGTSEHSSDTGGQGGKSVTDGVLGYLWDMVGLKAETEKFTTEKFRPSRLRHGG